MTERIVVYVHGMGGSADEAEHFVPFFPECEAVGFDYRSSTPWDAKDEFGAYFAGLKEEYKSVIQTGFGEDLSWKYLSYVREHPAVWNVQTDILYGSRDVLIRRESVDAFVRRSGARLTVFEGGEHWFHTAEQMRFLDGWIQKGEEEE